MGLAVRRVDDACSAVSACALLRRPYARTDDQYNSPLTGRRRFLVQRNQGITRVTQQRRTDTRRGSSALRMRPTDDDRALTPTPPDPAPTANFLLPRPNVSTSIQQVLYHV
jgi:hypothetical protein